MNYMLTSMAKVEAFERYDTDVDALERAKRRSTDLNAPVRVWRLVGEVIPPRIITAEEEEAKRP